MAHNSRAYEVQKRGAEPDDSSLAMSSYGASVTWLKDDNKSTVRTTLLYN